MEDRKPGIHTCNGCEKWQTCGASPFHAEPGRLPAADRWGFTMLRGWLNHFPEESYEVLGQVISGYTPERLKQSGMDEQTMKQLYRGIGAKIVTGAERVNRELTALKDAGLLRIENDEPDRQCTGYRPMNRTTARSPVEKEEPIRGHPDT